MGQRAQLIRCQFLRFLHSQFLLFVFFCVARSADLRSQRLEVRVAVADGPVDDGRLARAQQLLRNGVVNGDHIQLHSEQTQRRGSGGVSVCVADKRVNGVRQLRGEQPAGGQPSRLTVNGLDSCCSVVVARMASFHGPDAVGPLLLEAASADMAAVTAVRCSACSSGRRQQRRTAALHSALHIHTATMW